MNKLLMIVLMASAAVAFPGCRSHRHNKKPARHPPQQAVHPHPHPKASPHTGHHKAPPPPAGYKKAPEPVRPAPAPNGNVPPPKR